MHGILLLDKTFGYTAQQAVSVVKRLFHIKKAGHTGSLDPIATGLLPVCLGEATKFSQFLLAADKHYAVEALLGIRTDTGDSEGAILEEKAVPTIDIENLLEMLARFQGTITQVPPMFSAIKHKGKPLYYWARKGISIERTARPVIIYQLKLLNYALNTLKLEVRCSKGTYIRTLIEDIGSCLGCGAHVTALRRLSVGDYSVDQSSRLSDIESLSLQKRRTALVLPMESALSTTWPELHISEAAAFYLYRGQSLALPRTPKSGWVRLFLKPDYRLLGIGQILQDGRVAPYRLIQCEAIA